MWIYGREACFGRLYIEEDLLRWLIGENSLFPAHEEVKNLFGDYRERENGHFILLLPLIRMSLSVYRWEWHPNVSDSFLFSPGPVVPFKLVRNLETLWYFPFQFLNFFCVYLLLKKLINKWKIFSCQNKIDLIFKKVFFFILDGKHFPEVVKNLKSLFSIT
jgi:hypothetical protein